MPTQYDAIPLELRELKQWVLWKYEDKGAKKPTKIPYTIKHTQASVTNPEDWSTYNDAFNAFQIGGYSGLGFVFTKNDPYAGIDLDDTDGDQVAFQRQQKVFKEFDSYSELSPSGKGLHIIVKGSIPQGRRRSCIEIYSSERYFAMTGMVYANKPIADKHDLLNQLFNQMGGPPVVNSYTGNTPETETDEEIINKALSATNGDKFQKLFSGEWSSLYPSQSEADLAFIDIIAFYTQNRIQISRIFRNSALGKRNKANRSDYLNWMINKSFDRLLPQVDVDGFRIALEQKIALQQESNQLQLPLEGSVNGKPSPFEGANVGSSPAPSATQYNGHASVAQLVEPSAHNRSGASSNLAASTITPPPGLMGDIARFIYEASPRPVPEIAIAAAISFMAGICGRAYNVSGTGLNHYVLLLADTGSGKEAAKSGIDKLLAQVSMSVPVAREFMGPSQIASGQALFKALFRNPCFVSIIGEFGLRMQAMSDKHATSSEIKLRELMLDVYGKSGYKQVLEASVYADAEKNTTSIHAPAFSLFGESVPSEFYDHLEENAIKGGLLPRFIIIEYEGGRVPRNVGHDLVQPSMALIDSLASLMANAKTVMANRNVINVDITNEAREIADKFDIDADNRINNSNADQTKQLWNRAHLKLLKLAALVAVGCNHHQPIINVEHILWAKEVVENDIKKLSSKLASGLIGKNSEELQQISDMKRMIRLYLTQPWSKSFGPQSLHSAKIIPQSYLSQRLYNVASFKNDKFKAGTAISKMVKQFVDDGLLVEIGKKQLEAHNTTAKCYMVTGDFNLNE